MWRKEEPNPSASSSAVPVQNNAGQQSNAKPSPTSNPSTAKTPACVSQGIRIKGEVVGTEDLFIDGTVEGKVTILNSSVTVGPNAKVKADISAREVVLRGMAEGKFTAEERIQIWSTARVEGDLKSERISIEDGAQLRGKVEAGKVSAAASESLSRGKKIDQSKAVETPAKETNITGAATAGAD